MCFQELLRPTGMEDGEELANLAAYELATAVNLVIQSHTKK